MYTKSCVSKILHSYGDCQSSLHNDPPHIGRPRSVSLHLIFRTRQTDVVTSLSTITSEKGRTSHPTKMHPMLTTFTTATQTMILCTQAELSTISNLATSHSSSWTLVVIVSINGSRSYFSYTSWK